MAERAKNKAIRKVRFIKSAVKPEQYPQIEGPEIALMGRSNAGKSSLLNALAGRDVAKVSSSPGKTRLLNFFDCGGAFKFVDMPGYGFAKRSQKEIDGWQRFVETYMTVRGNIGGAILVMDVRRKWSPDEQVLENLCGQLGIPFAVALTKIDKLKQSEQSRARKEWKTRTTMAFFLSSRTGLGVKEFEQFIFDTWVKPMKAVDSDLS